MSKRTLTAPERAICDALGADHLERDGWNVMLFKTVRVEDKLTRAWLATVQGGAFPSIRRGDKVDLTDA